MFKHNIKIYQSRPDSYEMPVSFWITATAAIPFLFGLLSWGLWGMWSPFFVFIGIVILVVNGLLFLTNERFGMVVEEVKMWNKYRALDEDTQNRLNLCPKKIKAMPADVNWDTLVNEIGALHSVQIARREEEAKHSGEVKQILDTLRNERAEESRRLEDARSITKSLKEVELI